jgi:hypothetical protein
MRHRSLLAVSACLTSPGRQRCRAGLHRGLHAYVPLWLSACQLKASFPSLGYETWLFAGPCVKRRRKAVPKLAPFCAGPQPGPLRLAGPGSQKTAPAAHQTYRKHRKGAHKTEAGSLREPALLTAQLTRSRSVPELLQTLAAQGVPGTPQPSSSRASATLNSIQLCAALTTAERVCRRTADEEGNDCGTAAQGALPGHEAAALAGLVAKHQEVLADAAPAEMATALWAAAQLRLPLEPTVLEPVLEAMWLWDPAEVPASTQDAANGRNSTSVAAVGARELCLLVFAVSVLWPDYLRRHAGGFLEALESHEGRAGLTAEQLAGLLTSLSRAAVVLDEEGQELLLRVRDAEGRDGSARHQPMLPRAMQPICTAGRVTISPSLSWHRRCALRGSHLSALAS